MKVYLCFVINEDGHPRDNFKIFKKENKAQQWVKDRKYPLEHGGIANYYDAAYEELEVE